ncbi:BMP-binding endothelial regulator protein-like [Saccoglossus kowalevskii]
MVSVKADPFFYTFDGKNFKYDGQNGCVYVLFQECVYRPSFSVLIRHHFIEDAEKMVVSEVSVVLEDIRISLIKQNIYVNDEIMGVDSPVTYGNLTVARVSSEHIKISLGSRFSLKWNGSGRVAPILDQSMFGKVCGLLGNGDSNPDNDMQIPMPDGTLKTVNNIEEFGDSWRVPGSCKA